MRSNKGITLISVIVIILAIITAILVTVEVIVIVNDIKKEKVTTQEKEDNDIEEIEEVNENRISEETINKWVGKYEAGNVTVDIWRESVDKLTVDIMIIEENGFSSKGFITDSIEKINQISYEGESFDENINITITETDNGIDIEANSSEQDSLFNKVNGNYVKKEFERSGWDGLYVNGEIKIILSELCEQSLSITVLKGNSMFGRNIEEYTTEKIEYNEETIWEEENNIIIKKTAKGITVQASSTEEYVLLNKINGEYIKQE